MNALLRKNLTYQKRRPCLNVCLVILPLLFVGLLASLQLLINNALDSRDNKVCSVGIFQRRKKISYLQKLSLVLCNCYLNHIKLSKYHNTKGV